MPMLALNIALVVVSIAALVAFIILLISSFKRHVLWGLAVLLLPFATLVYGIKYWKEVKKPFLAYVAANLACLGLVAYLVTMLGGMAAIDMAQKINSGELTEQEAAAFMMQSMEGIEQLTGEGKEDMLAQMRQDDQFTAEDVAQAEQLFTQMEALAQGDIQSLEEGMTQSAISTSQPTGQEGIIKREVTSADEPEINKEEVQEETPVSPPPAAVTRSAQTIAEQRNTVVPVSRIKEHIGEYLYVVTKSGLNREGRLAAISGDTLSFERRIQRGMMSFELSRNDVAQVKLTAD